MELTLTTHIALYFLCFLLVWLGAGLVVSGVTKLATSWKIPRFILSFFVLGFFTSLPEVTIGTISVMNGDPSIIAGNLLGGVIVMFLCVIPLLGLLGNGVRIPAQLDKQQLMLTLMVVVAPAFLTADQRIGKWEAIFLILLYFTLFLFFSFKQPLLEKIKQGLTKKKKKGAILFAQMALGIGILVVASNQIVDSTLYFAEILRISPFFVSLIVVSLGTNIPEISIVFKSVISKKKDVALADYLGSASTNTLLLGVFTLMYGKTIQLPNHFFQRFAFLAIGLVLFFFFARSKNTLSRKESSLLFLLYIAFVVFELLFISQL